MTFKDKTNEEMVELYKKQADKMSFFPTVVRTISDD